MHKSNLDRFDDLVLKIVSQIPSGMVVTYGDIARALKSPRSARAVGNALNKNKTLIVIPCHRVVRSDGGVGGYVLGTEKKIELLTKEGVEICDGRVVDLESFRCKF